MAALFDSGSTTNLMSFALYNPLPNSVKSALKEFSFDKLELANGFFFYYSAWYSKGKSVCSSITQIYVCRFSCTGTDISACHSGHTVFGTVRYSDPRICSDVVYHNNYKVVSRNTFVLSPESEAVVFGSISDSRVYPGVHGMCFQPYSFAKSNAVSCKCIGVVDIDDFFSRTHHSLKI